jgi:hypothetical protein
MKLLHASAGFFLGLHFDPKDGGNMFLLSTNPTLNHMELQPKRKEEPFIRVVSQL